MEELFSKLPGDSGGHLEILRTGRPCKREVPENSKRTSRLHLLGGKCNQEARQPQVRKDLEPAVKGDFPRTQPWLLAPTGLGLTLGRLTGVLGLVLGFLIKSL